jgi:adenylyl-sulfate kinase
MGVVLWVTGLSGAGKTTIAKELEKHYTRGGKSVELLDGDTIRRTITKNLGFSREDIRKNNHLIAELAKERKNTKDLVIISITAPYGEDRRAAKELIGEECSIMHIDTTIETCISRDIKGLYKKVQKGEITNFIGVSSSNPYEIPEDPDVHVPTGIMTIEECVTRIKSHIEI